jgi:membrane associated rhomboid family serine protease
MFIIIPTGVNYRTDRMPVVTFSIMGVNALLYLISLVMFWSGGASEENDWLVDHFGLIPAESIWYTYITSLFVHAGFFHLLGNMMYLFLFGSCVEDILGRWQYVIFYLIGGLVADFGHILASAGNFDSTLPTVGASGAISACMGGFVLLLHGNKIDFKYILFFFFRFFVGEFALPAWLVMSFWFLKDLVFALLAASSPNGGGGVAFAAHVGGFVGGMGMVGIWKLLMRGRRPADDVEETFSADGVRPRAPAIYLFENDTQTGPFSPQQIAEMQAVGSVSPDALYWQDGMADWRSVSELSPGA